MATDNPTITRGGDFSTITYHFAGLDNGDDGAPIRVPEFADKSVQVTGTFGAEGAVALEGSNKVAQPTVDADWKVLTDPQGNVLSFTSAGIEAITENTRWIRPHVTAGDGTTDLDVTILVRRPTDLRT